MPGNNFLSQEIISLHRKSFHFTGNHFLSQEIISFHRKAFPFTDKSVMSSKYFAWDQGFCGNPVPRFSGKIPPWLTNLQDMCSDTWLQFNCTGYGRGSTNPILPTLKRLRWWSNLILPIPKHEKWKEQSQCYSTKKLWLRILKWSFY